MSDGRDLAGHVSLVTGGSRGLGRAIAFALAEQGSNVVVASRDEAACVAVAEEVTRASGRRALGIELHVGRWDAIEPAVGRVIAEFGRIDVLVNNAGMSPLYDTASSVTEELFDKVIGVNLKGPFRLSALVGEHMAAGSGGSIVNISSAGSIRPRSHILPYAAAKAGLNALTVGLAHTFGPTVRVNAILAGTFATDVSRSWSPEEVERRTETFAMRRVAQPEEIVGTVVYLASDASSYTTGALISVDGGQP